METIGQFFADMKPEFWSGAIVMVAALFLVISVMIMVAEALRQRRLRKKQAETNRKIYGRDF